jgi:hypothetical protein
VSDEKPDSAGVTRLSFIKASAGVAAGAAAVGIPAAAALSGGDTGVVTEPTSAAPREPVMAYVRDVERAEVTVMHGTREITYRDPVLVKRLMASAPEAGLNGGGIDVLAP